MPASEKTADKIRRPRDAEPERRDSAAPEPEALFAGPRAAAQRQRLSAIQSSPASAAQRRRLSEAVGAAPVAPVVQRHYIENAEGPEFLTVDGKKIGYTWDASVPMTELEVSPVKTGWKAYYLYRRKASEPVKTAAKTEVKKEVKAEVKPKASGEQMNALRELSKTLGEWGMLANDVDKNTREERGRLARRVKAAIGDEDASDLKELTKDVGALKTDFDLARQKVEKRSQEKSKEQSDRLLKEQELEAFDKQDKELLKRCNNNHQLKVQLVNAFGHDGLGAVLDLVPAPTLPQLLGGFEPDVLKLLLAGTSDLGQGVKALLPQVGARDHATQLLAKPFTISPAQLKLLLADTRSATLLALPATVTDGALMLTMRAKSANEGEFKTKLEGLVAAGWDPAQAKAAIDVNNPLTFDNDLLAQKRANGLIADNGTEILWMSETAIAGDGDANEQAAVTAALVELDAGNGNVPFVCEARGGHNNNQHRLPGAPGVVPYQEWGIKPPTGKPWPDSRRLVQDTNSDRIYYTWTHYGDNGPPAYRRIR